MIPLLTTRFPYSRRVLSVAGDGLIAYWPLNEPSGAVAYDLAGYRRNGAFTGVDLGYPGIGDGNSAPYFDGVNDYVNIYSASLNSAFNNQEGSLLLWAQMSAVGIWTDGLVHFLAYIGASATNRVVIFKNAANNLESRYTANSVNNIRLVATTTIAPFQVVITWSKSADQVIVYFNGVKQGATLTGLGVWSGALATTLCILGAGSLTPIQVHSGQLAHAAVWNRALQAGEVAELYRVTA